MHFYLLCQIKSKTSPLVVFPGLRNTLVVFKYIKRWNKMENFKSNVELLDLFRQVVWLVTGSFTRFIDCLYTDRCLCCISLILAYFFVQVESTSLWAVLPPPPDTRASSQNQPRTHLPLPQPQVHTPEPQVTQHVFLYIVLDSRSDSPVGVKITCLHDFSTSAWSFMCTQTVITIFPTTLHGSSSVLL